MNSQDLVHGVILAQKNSGGDLVDTLNTSSFQHMPLKQKVDFINQYAQQGGPEPKAPSNSEKVKKFLASTAGAAVAGGLVGAAMHVSRGGKLITPHIHSPLNQGKLTPEEAALADAELSNLFNKMKGATQIGALVGGLSSASALHQESSDAKKVQDALRRIRAGEPHHATALAINSDYLHGRRSSSKEGAGFTDVQKIVKDNLIF